MSNVLITGARAPVALELARLFRAAGHTVFAADSLPWPMCRGSNAVTASFRLPPPNRAPAAFTEALSGIIRRHGIELLIPTCEEIYFVAMGRARLSQLCAVFTPPLDVLHRLHHKFSFAQLAQQVGLPVPETRLLTDPSQAAPLLSQGIVLKPAYSRFASQAVILPRRPADIPRGISPARPWVAQRFVAGRQFCTYSIAHSGRVVAHSGYATTLTAGQGASIVFRQESHPAALAWVERLVAALEFSGQIAFDFIETPAGELLAIECNPRTISGIHLFWAMPQVAQAFLQPPATLLTPPPGETVRITTALLLMAPRHLRPAARRAAWRQAITAGRDAVYRRDDPLPGLVSQWLTFGTMLARSLRHRVGLTAATTLDIEWNGEKA